jgi:predicted anti-sigma-YlaC factor YlaD
MRPSLCDRTRALLSEGLDAPMSEVERRAIARHTSECAACRAFEAQSHWLTRELRTAPLEPIPRPVVVSHVQARRLSSRVMGNVASAAALLVVVVGGYAVGTDRSVDQTSELGITSGPGAESAQADPLRALRVDALRAGELAILPESDPPRGVKPARPATDG